MQSIVFQLNPLDVNDEILDFNVLFESGSMIGPPFRDSVGQFEKQELKDHSVTQYLIKTEK